ncbi:MULTISPECIES: AIPR family protein [unclassified Microcoleus]|uniref:AIPR family protein n=1 Tax=unclassified Microcoleus TaxID=2642155 RepID=UPI002FD17035
MDIILQSFFNDFKNNFELNTVESDPATNGAAFEKFVNYVLFSLDYPDIFTADAELLDFVCVGAGYDTGIDGIGIKVNDRLVKSIDEISDIAQESKRINIEFLFIQSKMRSEFDVTVLNKLGTGVKVFFSDDPYLPQNSRIKEFREIKDFIYSNEEVIRKLDKIPSLILYYVSTARSEPTDENFLGSKKFLIKELKNLEKENFETVEVKIVGGDRLKNFCRELKNQFDVQMNVIDIFPMIVDSKTDVKRADAFTCEASEFLKILTKEDGSLRRSLFNDNVRDYLGDNKTVNSEIETTINENPEMFLLCNNGVTIVCTEFQNPRGKLVKITNPQIVNGCQTSNSLFNQRENPRIEKVKLLIRLISTENPEISNKIVRGTNKQNQVLEEAFETTRSFHKEKLEPFFLAFENDVKLYYERRSKQYSNDPHIKKDQIVNLRTLTQVFVSVFLDSPHDGHRHESTLLREYVGQKEPRKIFVEDHSPYPYYVSALIWYRFEKYFRNGEKDQTSKEIYKTYKAHLYLIFRMTIGEFPPKLTKQKSIEDYCKKLIEILQEDKFTERLEKVWEIFYITQKSWVGQGKSRYGMKDREEFTDLLLRVAREKFIQTPVVEQEEDEDNIIYEGTILKIIHKDDGSWFGFIKHVNRDEDEDNVYFDNRSYKGNIRYLSPNTTYVRFERGRNQRGY